MVGLFFGASAQQKQLAGEHYASNDITVTGTYTIKDDQMTVTVTITNNSTTNYKDVVYQIKSVDKDGKVLQSTNYPLTDPIAAGATVKLKKMSMSCREGTKTLTFAIIDGTKAAADKSKK